MNTTTVFSIGRYNPPTIGHEILIKKVVSVAKNHNANIIVFTTRTQDKKRNPLDVGNKLAYLRSAFPGIPFIDVTTAANALEYLDQQGNTYVILVTGSDRADTYDNMISRMITAGYIQNIKTYDIVRVDRDPDSNTVSGVSASKAREFANTGDIAGFKNIAPSKLSNEQKDRLYHSIRQGMGFKK